MTSIWADPTVAVVTNWLLDHVGIDARILAASNTLWTKADTGNNVLTILEHPNNPSTKSEFHYQPHVKTDHTELLFIKIAGCFWMPKMHCSQILMGFKLF